MSEKDTHTISSISSPVPMYEPPSELQPQPLHPQKPIQPDHAYLESCSTPIPVEPDTYPMHMQAPMQPPMNPGPASPPPVEYQAPNQEYNQEYNQDYNQKQQQNQQPPPQKYATAAPLHTLNRASVPVDCPVCGVREMTRVQAQTGNTNHGWAAVICCCFCLGCIPYLMSSLKDVEHHCGNCSAHLATWHNSGHTDVHQTGQPRI